jgi:hypothetical protein
VVLLGSQFELGTLYFYHLNVLIIFKIIIYSKLKLTVRTVVKQKDLFYVVLPLITNSSRIAYRAVGLTSLGLKTLFIWFMCLVKTLTDRHTCVRVK